MKRIVLQLILLWVVAGLLSTACAESLSIEGMGEGHPAYAAFSEAHPDVTIDTFSHNQFYSTNQVLNQLVTGEFPYDVFSMEFNTFNVRKLIDKGYCADVSDSAFIQQELRQMYPSIVEQVSQDGKLYGVPDEVRISYYAYNPQAWEAAGLSQEDVPTSFTGLLDFLEKWVERISENPEDQISVCYTFDADLYGEHSYVLYLTDRLIESHVMQCSYANEPIRFNTPEFRDLLGRCEKIGRALYQCEPVKKGSMQLFDNVSGMRDLYRLVPLRLTEKQPILIQADLHIYFVNASSDAQELSTEFLESILATIQPEYAAYLYQTSQAVENPYFQDNLTNHQRRLANLEAQLEDETLSPDDRERLELDIEAARLHLETYQTPENQYVILEDDLALYHSLGDYLYFQPPSVFDPSTDNGQNMQQLRDLFCAGQLPLEQFVSRLDELAWMVEMENE